MNQPATQSEEDRRFLRRAIEAAVRIGVLAILLLWCFTIAQPFLVPIVWGVVVAVAVYPAYRRLRASIRVCRIQ